MPSRRVFTALLLFLLVFSGAPRVSAQENGETEQFFPKYRQWVSGEFYQMYKSVDDPGRIFGDPFSMEFDDPARPGVRMQYFERARMDYDPSKPAGQRVTLANLGEYARPANDPGLPQDYSTYSSMCQSFPQGILVCFAFLQFYQHYAQYTGLPITNAELVDGQIVQYFEKVRMEWRNEMPSNYKVVLTPLGRVDFDKRIGNDAFIQPNPRNITGSQPLQMRVYAFAARPLISAGQQQEIDVLVVDQTGRPVPDAVVTITAQYPEKTISNVEASGPTDAMGFTRGRFTVQEVAPNSVVQIKVTTRWAGLPEENAITWFRVWW